MATTRPYVLRSTAVTVDGYLGDAGPELGGVAGRPPGGGLTEHPMKVVVVTGSGDLDPSLALWHCGGAKLVVTVTVTVTVDAALARVRATLGPLADASPTRCT
jgi:hypothetical protein